MVIPRRPALAGLLGSSLVETTSYDLPGGGRWRHSLITNWSASRNPSTREVAKYLLRGRTSRPAWQELATS